MQYDGRDYECENRTLLAEGGHRHELSWKLKLGIRLKNTCRHHLIIQRTVFVMFSDLKLLHRECVFKGEKEYSASRALLYPLFLLGLAKITKITIKSKKKKAKKGMTALN